MENFAARDVFRCFCLASVFEKWNVFSWANPSPADFVGTLSRKGRGLNLNDELK